MNQEQLEELIAQYFDGSLSEEQEAYLREALRSAPEARELMAEYMRIEGGMLHIAKMAGPADSDESCEPPGERPRLHVRRTPSSARLIARRFGGQRRTPLAVRYAVVTLSAAAAVVLAVVFLRGAPRREHRSAEGDGASAARVARELPLSGGRPEARPDSEEPAPMVEPAPRAPARGLPREHMPAAVVAEESAGEEAAPAIEVATGGPSTAPTSSPAGPAGGRRAAHLAYLDALEGDVELQPSGAPAWAKASAGAPLAPGDGLRTRLSRARIVFESGTRLHVNRWSALRLDADGAARGLHLVGGEVFVGTVPADKGFWVHTPHGRATDLGTRFGVSSTTTGTTVYVVEGRVDASTEAGTTHISAGTQARLTSNAHAPGPATDAANLEARIAWTRPPQNEIVLRPTDGTMVGGDWRIADDPEGTTGVVLEAPEYLPEPGPRGRGPRKDHVLFEFEADGGKPYRLWVRGKCTAARNRLSHDCVTIVVESGLCYAGDAPGRRPNTPPTAVAVNGYSVFDGYVWLSGRSVYSHPRYGERPREEMRPDVVIFPKTGRQRLRLVADETPMRIDTIWLSASQGTQPEASQAGPADGRPQ